MSRDLFLGALVGMLLPAGLGAQGYTGNLNRGSGAGMSMGRANDATLLSACEELERRAEYLVKVHRKAVKQHPEAIDLKDELEAEVSNLWLAASSLYSSWSFQRNLERSRKDFAQVLRAGYVIQRALPKHPLRGRLQGDWEAVRDEIDELLAIFRMPKLNWDLIAEQPPK